MANLNPWYALLWRRFEYMIRRLFFSFDTPLRHKLYMEKMHITSHEIHGEGLTDMQMARLREINHTLGNDSIYRLTPEQAQEQVKLVKQILEELKKEEMR